MLKKLIIIPTYNERHNITSIIARIFELGLPDLHVLVVDDNSPDGTAQAVREAFADHLTSSRVTVLVREAKQGLGRAYVAAFKWAVQRDYDLVVQMDADFSHDPQYLPALFRAASEDAADVVLGSRYIAGGGTLNWGWLRHAMSFAGNFYVRKVLNVAIKDATGGFKCFHRRVLELIDLDRVACRGYAFQVEMTYRAMLLGFTVMEIPIVFEERRAGQSKMTLSIAMEAIFKVLQFRVRKKNLLRGAPQKR